MQVNGGHGEYVAREALEPEADRHAGGRPAARRPAGGSAGRGCDHWPLVGVAWSGAPSYALPGSMRLSVLSRLM
jgi:hypothetical protein